MQEVQERSERNIGNLHEISLNLFEAVKLTNENVNTISDTVEKLSDKVGELADAQKETDERLRETDERLNAVIFMAERFFSGENGKSG